MDTNRDLYLDEDEIQGQEIVCFPFEVECDDCDDDKEFEYVCHKLQIGNDWKFVTLYVPQAAVQAHLDHGDELGECEDNQ